MSAIHEALKKARSVRKNPEIRPAEDARAQSAPVIEVRQAAPRSTVGWMVAVVMIGVAAFSWEYAHATRLQKKLTQALLALNDTRGDYLSVQKKKIEDTQKMSTSIDDLKEKIRKAEAERNRVWLLKQTVEVENLQKEKKISEITKQKHDLEMTRWRLAEEVEELKKEMDAQRSFLSSSGTSSKSER